MRFSGDSLSRDLIGKLPPQISVHVLRIRDDSDSAKIESVCIPAGSDGGIRMVRGLRVPDACRLQQIELRIRDLKMDIAKITGIGRTSSPMVGICKLILPPAVMEESEETHYRDVRSGLLGQQKSVLFDPPPVVRAMVGMHVQLKLAGNDVPESLKIDA